ncbi:hypothetical protein WHR41_09172 [Cladosporium halotolerans]|uniref:Major facilitator superfamily (MFS) profile domain-containing protein n=1 Tax=Cladosporium halotolerans TaxID=1052096 RepID=A0AB34KDP3_9PEZI
METERDAYDGQPLYAEREDVPPDGGYGWVVAACVFLINVHTWGVNSSWGVFLAHFLSQSQFENATHLQYALIGGLSISQALLVSSVVSTSNDKLGTRASLAIGTLLISVSMLASSYATSVWQLFLSQGACFGYGMGFLYITGSAVLPQWFSKRRSLAVAISSSGAGFGGLAYNLGVGSGIEQLGWRWTYIVLAISTLLANTVCVMLIRDRNKVVQPQRRFFDRRLFAHVSTWLIITWGVVTDLGYITLLYSLPNYSLSIGLTARQGSVVGAMLSLGIALGRPPMGYWADRHGRINVAIFTTAACGVLCFALWIPAKSYAVLIIFALTSGTVTGTFWASVVPVTAEIVGMQKLSLAFSMVCLSLVLPTTFAEGIALGLVSSSGYLSAQVFVGCMYVLGALSIWGLRSWKVRETDDDELREREGRSSLAVGTPRAYTKFWLTQRGLFLRQKV